MQKQLKKTLVDLARGAKVKITQQIEKFSTSFESYDNSDIGSIKVQHIGWSSKSSSRITEGPQDNSLQVQIAQLYIQ